MEKMKENKKYILIIMVVFCSSILLGGVLGFILSKEVFSSNETNNDSIVNSGNEDICSDEEKYQECITDDVTDDDKADGAEVINKLDDNVLVVFHNGSLYDVIHHKINAFEYIDSLNKDLNTIDDLSNQEILMFIATKYFDDDKMYSLEAVNELSVSWFGKTVIGEDIKDSLYENDKYYLYDDNKKLFKKNPDYAGRGYPRLFVLNNVTDIETKGTKIIVKVKKAFSIAPEIGPLDDSFYRTYSDCVNKKSPLFALPSEGEIKQADDYEMQFFNYNESKLATYEYIFDFDKDNRNLVLVSYKRGK